MAKRESALYPVTSLQELDSHGGKQSNWEGWLMGVRILYDPEAEMATLYCSTTGIAFGQVFYETADPYYISAHDMAEQFIQWLPQDARRYSDTELAEKHAEFMTRVCDVGAFWEVVAEDES